MTKYICFLFFPSIQLFAIEIASIPVKDEARSGLKLAEIFSEAIDALDYRNECSYSFASKLLTTYNFDFGKECKVIRDDEHFPNINDVTNLSDSVNEQYMSLPYRPVSSQTLKDESAYYTLEKGNIPFQITPSLSLEALNHFLFKGRNKFR